MAKGYDRDPITGPSKFLRLKGKGDSVKFRILSEPYREPKVWNEEKREFLSPERIAQLTKAEWLDIMRTPDYSISDVFYWVVRDRGDNRTKIFGGSGGVYKKIKKYAQTAEWGDPTGYDLIVERTEDPGTNYYAVEALPNKSQLSEEEVMSARSVDIKKEIPIARLNSEPQIDDITEELEAHKSQPRDQDPVSEVPDEPVNLDDIPF